MILNNMRLYDFYTFGELNAYGVQSLSKDIKGQVKLSIYTTSQSVQDNIKYKDASYIALTYADIDDSYVIQYGKEKLKVLYVNTQGRMKQVFLKSL